MQASEGKIYLCAIKDVFSNRIVGYSIDAHMKATLAVRTLKNAVGSRRSGGKIVHTDRGSPASSAP
jgi:transposase InsO family protein